MAFNTAAQFIGKILGLAVSLTTIGIMFRFLGVEGVGKYTTVFAFTSFFTLFADIGLGWTMLRELTVEKDRAKVFNNIFTMRLILGIIVFSACALIVWLFNYPVDVKWAVAGLSVAMLFQSLVSVAVSLYLNSYRMDLATGAEVIGKLVILGIIYIISRTGGSLMGVMLAYVAGCLVNLVIVWLFAGNFIKGIGLQFDRKYWKYALNLSWPIGITLVFAFLYYKVDSIMLSLLKGMIDVGIYGTAYKILEVLQIFPALFLGSAFSLITKYITEGDERVHSAFQKQFDFLILIAAPIVAITLVLSPQIIRFIAGAKDNFTTASTVVFAGYPVTSITVLRILIFSVGVNFFSSLYNFMIVSLGKQKQMVWPTVGFAMFNILVNLYLIPRFSYLGAAVSTLLTEIVVVTTARYIVSKNISLKLRLGNFAKTLLCAILMVAVTYLFFALGLPLLVNLLFSIVIYGLLALSFRVIPVEMLASVFKFKK